MKKVIVIMVMVLVLCGCNSKQNTNKSTKNNENEAKKEEKINKYKDENNTTVGLYFEKGRKLELVKDYSADIISEKDIGVYQVYFSNDEVVNLDTNFGESYYNLYKDLGIKVGFNIKYSLSNGESINHTITNPSNTIINDYILTYLYDDYKNRNSNFYSHIEDNDYYDSTLFTSIKLFANSVDDVKSPITLTVFTYDTDDDFDSEGNYRGNSKYTVNISKK